MPADDGSRSDPAAAAQLRPDPWPAPRGKAARTRRRLILAAEAAFSECSVERAKVEDIAALADVSVGTLYAHFGSKEGLAIAYLDAVFDLLDADLAALEHEPSAFRRVLAAGDAYVQHVIDYPVASRMASVRAAYPPAEHQGPMAERLDRRMVTTLMGVATDLKKSMDTGEIPSAPIEEVMVFVWGAWHGAATMIARCDQLTVPPEIAQRALARGRRVLIASIGIDDAWPDDGDETANGASAVSDANTANGASAVSDANTANGASAASDPVTGGT